MKYRAVYTFSFGRPLSEDVEIPLRLEIDAQLFEISEIDEGRENAVGFLETPVDPQELTLSDARKTISGTRIPPRIIVQGSEKSSLTASTIIDILSFITDTPIRRSSRIDEDELIPESEEDRTLLESLGTEEIHHETRVSAYIRSFLASELRDDYLPTLMDKEAGLAIYSVALLQQHDTGTYRELWRVLESAFGAQNAELLSYLREFVPAKQLGFNYDELNSLHILRGRASHSASSAGMSEVIAVNRGVSDKLPRLKCLVEQVLLTKQTWGAKSNGTDRLAPLAAYINADGSVIVRRGGSPDPNVGA